MVAVAVSNREFHVPFLARGDDFIRLRRRAAKGLLDVDAARAGFGSGENHVAVLVHKSRRDGDDVRLHLGEHFAVVGKAGNAAEFFPRGGEARGIGIGHGDDFRLGHLLPHCINTVAVVAAPCVADDSDAEFLFVTARGDGDSGGDSEGEEMAAVHE
jgi:hypothetical protein